MSSRDWKALYQRFKKEHANTGIALKDFCARIEISHSTASRHISVSRVRQELVQEGYELRPQRTVGTPCTENSAPRRKKKKRSKIMYDNFILGDSERLGRYEQAKDATLRDELYVSRTILSELLETVKRVEKAIKETTDPKLLASLCEQHINATEAIDKRVGRIESLEHTLTVIDHKEADMARVKEVTRKTRMENERSERQQGTGSLTNADMLKQLMTMESDGMVSN